VRPEDLGIGRLFASIRDAVIVAEASSGRIVLWNPAAEEIFGYPLSEALGLNIDALVPERLKARHRAGMARYRDTGHGPYVDSNELLDLPALRKGGEEIRVEMSLTPVVPTEGAAAGRRFALAIARDVTERSEARRRVEESEERFRLVARATNEVIWDSDLKTDKQVWDGAVEAMLGYPAQQVTNTAWWEERVHPEDRGRVTASVEAVLGGGGEVWSEEYRFRRADGGYSDVADRAHVVRDNETGEPVRVLGSMMDVSDRRRAEEALRESEERFRVLIQNALDIIMVTDADGTIRYISPAVERVLGYRPEEMVGANTADYVHPDDLEGAFGELAAALASPGVHPVAVETRVRHKSGSWRWLEGIANNLLWDPAVKGLVFNHRDVTERKRIEQELERRAAELESSNAELERFAYAVAHDLRAPLRTISSFSQLLLEDHAGGLDEEGEDYLRRVGNAGRHMAQVMDALLDLSRIARGEMRHEEVNLSSLVEDIAAELKRGQPDRRVEFAIQGDLVAEGDRRLLRLALENLLGNAFKFTAKKPEARIEFGATDQDGAPAYYVRDNGAGFDQAYAGKLFGAFQRLHDQDEFDGVGIGLAAVARVVRRHGGRVWAEGEVGRGATFYFTL
jgi:PAS domain S-box-containing protein